MKEIEGRRRAKRRDYHDIFRIDLVYGDKGDEFAKQFVQFQPFGVDSFHFSLLLRFIRQFHGSSFDNEVFEQRTKINHEGRLHVPCREIDDGIARCVVLSVVLIVSDTSISA